MRPTFAYQHREVWVSLFIKYSSPISSSTAVERLFSMAGHILTPQSSSLAEANFEELLLIKGNMGLLEEKMGEEDIEKMEEENM